MLNFTNQNGITGTTGVNHGVYTLTLTGSATVAQYQSALQSVTFSNTTNNPNTTTRTVVITVSDGSLTSNSVNESVKVSLPAPVVTASGTHASFTAGGPAVVVDSGLTVSSYDTSHLTGAAVKINSPAVGRHAQYSPIKTASPALLRPAR